MARAKAKDDRLKNALAFERPVRELDLRIAELRAARPRCPSPRAPAGRQKEPDRGKELAELEQRRDAALAELQAGLTIWQRIQLSRHIDRPGTNVFLDLLFTDVVELHGDRLYGDDKAIFTGLATLDRRRLLVVGHRKGRTTQERIECNWGCAHPEGYRKALRAMQLADRMRLPVLTFINTPGAYPGIGAEERGQASAVAWNILEMFGLKVPVVSVVIGEGGSGGALGIGVCDRLLVLENSYYSVISPEGCASILWKDGSRAEEAALALKLGSDTLVELGRGGRAPDRADRRGAPGRPGDGPDRGRGHPAPFRGIVRAARRRTAGPPGPEIPRDRQVHRRRPAGRLSRLAGARPGLRGSRMASGVATRDNSARPAAQRGRRGRVGAAMLPALKSLPGRPMTVPNRDDHELIRAVLDGNTESFAALVKRHEQRAFWAAYRVLGDAEASRDVAQEAFVRVWRALERFDFSMAFSTWLYRITINLAIDHLRRNKRHKGVDIDTFREALADETTAPAPHAGQDRAELTQLVRSVLETLDEKYRTVLALRDLEGLSSKQISDITGIAHATVRWRLHVARKQFRENWNRRESRASNVAHRKPSGTPATPHGRTTKD